MKSLVNNPLCAVGLFLTVKLSFGVDWMGKKVKDVLQLSQIKVDLMPRHRFMTC